MLTKLSMLHSATALTNFAMHLQAPLKHSLFSLFTQNRHHIIDYKGKLWVPLWVKSFISATVIVLLYVILCCMIMYYSKTRLHFQLDIHDVLVLLQRGYIISIQISLHIMFTYACRWCLESWCNFSETKCRDELCDCVSLFHTHIHCHLQNNYDYFQFCMMIMMHVVFHKKVICHTCQNFIGAAFIGNSILCCI